MTGPEFRPGWQWADLRGCYLQHWALMRQRQRLARLLRARARQKESKS